jgi:predicted RNase H-like HicB family nuclease
MKEALIRKHENVGSQWDRRSFFVVCHCFAKRTRQARSLSSVLMPQVGKLADRHALQIKPYALADFADARHGLAGFLLVESGLGVRAGQARRIDRAEMTSRGACGPHAKVKVEGVAAILYCPRTVLRSCMNSRFAIGEDVPDLPGCITTGASLEETELNIREAIEGHLRTLTEFGEPVPESTSLAREIEISPAA